MKADILKILRENGGFVSGADLSVCLGISRVGIWKHMQALIKAGYNIETTSKGYKLVRSPDILFPFEFPEYEGKIQHFNEIHSTMDVSQYRNFSIAVAEKQTNGRGRMGRAWQSPEGGIYFTLGMKEELPLGHAQRLNLFACCAVAAAVREDFGLHAAIKWPNDILINGRKLAGILVEVRGDSERVNYARIGMGININNRLDDLKCATSLKKELGREISRREFFGYLISKLVKEKKYIYKEELIRKYRSLSGILGETIRMKYGGRQVRGKVMDFESDGGMILKTDAGKIKLVSGEVMNEY